MLLYHYSETSYKTLTPQSGDRRHLDEHKTATGHPGVWLTEDGVNPPIIGGWKPKFRHVVEVDEADKLLSLDTTTATLEEKWATHIGIPPLGFQGPRTYFYFGEIEVINVQVLSCDHSRLGS